MKRILCVALGITGLMMAGSCGNLPNGAQNGYPQIKSARSLSEHYVLVQFEQPAGSRAGDPSSYVIVDPEFKQLDISSAVLSEDGMEVMLATDSQKELEYRVAIGDSTTIELASRVLPTGALGFQGTTQREPFLESAVSLSNTQILLTFSQQMDRTTAETVAFYEIADPDTDEDVDIRVTAAALQQDYTSVILTTTEQRNTEYQIRVTNVKRRLSCDDGGRVVLDTTTQGLNCSNTVRPKEPSGDLGRFVLSARTQIDRNATTNPNATGQAAYVSLDANGAGVRRPFCTSGNFGINGDLGTEPDEELILTLDYPVSAQDVVLNMHFLDFVADNPVFFISSAASASFDYVINTAEIRAAYVMNGNHGDIVFANLPSLPVGLKIDALKVRETNSETWVYSVCGFSANRRLIDPTRNVASFLGIPVVDNVGPRVVKATSISNTEMAVSFSEPVSDDAANPINFTISPDLTVIDAVLGKFNTQVILTTSPQFVDVVYTVTVANVKDKAGNLIDPEHDTATFSYTGGPGGLGPDVLPRVAGAASTGNTGVLVTFTKPMGESAEVASNYVIVQQNVNPEVGALGVLSAEFLTPQHDAVLLTTVSQNEVTYLLRAVNVRDLFGNQIAPPQLLVDPATALFPGTPFSCGGPVCDGGFNDANSCNPNQTDPDADCKDGDEDGVCIQPPCSPPDQDGDGLLDHVELRGYVVSVELTNGNQIEREVTSDMRNRDTDGDGLNDAEERRIGCDPRQTDTDDDQLSDWIEYNFVYSNQNDQDSDNDGIDDLLEVDFFKTNALLADSDGDGFTDGDELFVMNRDPRIADLPQPGLIIGSIDLHLDEQFSYVDDEGVVRTEESSTSSTLAASNTRTVGTNNSTNLGWNINGKVGFGIEGPPIKASFNAEVSGGYNYSQAFQSTQESADATTSSYESSLSKGYTISGSTSFTRNVVGGRIDALVNLENLGDVAFKLSNLEITVLAPNAEDRTSLVPVATLIPNKTLVTGEAQSYNIGVLDGSSRGPIMFSSRDVFAALVEDLMRDPRGLLFQFANYDLEDEFERNFAFASQTARDRTVGLVIDYGDGNPERFLMAYAPVRFSQSSCDPEANPGCDIVGGFGGFSDAGIPGYGGLGPPPGLPLEYVLEQVLQKRRGEPVITALWLPQPTLIPETSESYACVGGFNAGGECDPNQGDPHADCEDGVSDGVCSNLIAPDGILAGLNGVSDSIAQGDDIQLIPFGIDGLPEDSVVITAGENGVLESVTKTGDVSAVITGYSTSKTCGPDTPSSIRPGPNGIVDTIRDPFSDDVQLQAFGSTQPFATNIIGPGTNGFIDTAPAGDDVFVGPGIPCDDNADCVAPGVCDGQEHLYRFEHRARGQYGRIWAVLVPDANLIGLDFRKVVLHPGDSLNMAFIQDLDRDGLISDVEFLFGSSDTKQDTDGEGLDDFSEVRVGWEIGVEGSSLRRVFPDPRVADSDQDTLSDREEQDFRRVQCECVGGSDDGNACNRDIASGASPEHEACRTGTTACMNVADSPVAACSRVITANRLDPRRRDTDEDLVSDADEVLGWRTQAAVIDPKNVIIAGADRDADTRACPLDVCAGGSRNGLPCRFQRDCPPEKECSGGVNNGSDCVNDIDCNGPTPATSGLCNETTASHTCNRTACDDVQVVDVASVGLNQRTVVVAPGPNGVLETTALAGDTLVASGNLRAQTSSLGDDQQIALVDPTRALVDTPIGRTIIRPGVNGTVDTLPVTDDVVAMGQFMKTTNPLSPDTDRDQIAEGQERILGSDPRDSTDGGFLGDKDGDGLSDGQEEIVGWIVIANGGTPVDVHSNPNASDTDLDGLPDYAEFVLRTNPNELDTDGDGLNDLDELTEDQLATLDEFNDLFPNFVLNVASSEAYGTSPIDCDTDADYLTDDFELLEGWNVTLTTSDGTTVKHVFTSPTNEDTDADGLWDAGEYKHTLGGSPVPSTDPTDYDSDNDGRVDGVECTNQTPVLADCTNPTSEVLATCTSNPLRGDKRVTIRYTQLTVDRGNDEVGGNTVDMSWRFQAQKSTETYPGAWYGVRTDRPSCEAIGQDAWCYQGGYCSVPEGTDFVFQGPHCRYFGNACTTNSDCSPFSFGHCSFLTWFPCSTNNQCPFSWAGETCQSTPDACVGGNEVVFDLQPGQGILLNGEASQYNDCRSAECTGGPYAGNACDPFNPDLTCCPRTCTSAPSLYCTSDANCPRLCTSGGAQCTSDANCPRFCTGTTTQCTSNAQCTSPATCGPNTSCGPNSACGPPPCTGIQCEAPFADNHVIYAKSLSYETLQYGFTVEIARLTDATDVQQFSLTLIVEIIVE